MSVPPSRRWVAKLCRSEWAVTRLPIRARFLAARQADDAIRLTLLHMRQRPGHIAVIQHGVGALDAEDASVRLDLDGGDDLRRGALRGNQIAIRKRLFMTLVPIPWLLAGVVGFDAEVGYRAVGGLFLIKL